MAKEPIDLQVTILAPVALCWKLWTTAEDIMHWNAPNDDWHTPRAKIDLRVGGEFSFRMETKDGKTGFDHAGKYDKIVPLRTIEYTGTDGRQSWISFTANADETTIVERFIPDDHTPLDLQREFVTGVLHSFKDYAEGTR